MTSVRLLLLAGLLLPLPAYAASHRAHHGGAPVILTRQPGTAADHAARTLNREDLQGAARHGETPLVLVGSAPLWDHRTDQALFVQLQSASLCGSAGCSTSVYLRHDHNWTKVLDSVSGPIRVMPQSHDGMHDLLVGRNDRWTWSGNGYKDTLAAPPLLGLKRSVEQHRAAVRKHELAPSN